MREIRMIRFFMKKGISLLCLLLGGILLFGGAIGCGGKPGQLPSGSGTEVKTNSGFAIICPDGVSGSLKNTARRLCLALEEAGAYCEFSSDAAAEATYVLEIVPSDPELEADCFSVARNGVRLRIAGGSESACVDAIWRMLALLPEWSSSPLSLTLAGKIGDSILCADDLREYDIVYARSESGIASLCARHIAGKIEQYYGFRPEVVASGEGHAGKHIYIGTQDDSVSKKLKYSLSDREYAVQVSIENGSADVYIEGFNDEALWRAAIFFYDCCLKRDGVSVPAQLRVRLRAIFARDPYILQVGDTYYFYANIDDRVWGAYTSKDLIHWSDSYIPVCTPENQPSGFDGVSDFWAPEVHEYRGKYYLFATYRRRGDTANYRVGGIFRSDSPEGPFIYNGDGPIVPFDGMVADGKTVPDASAWSVIDPTLYVDTDGQPWIVFSHEWVSLGSRGGTFCAARLSEDLSRIEGEVTTLFGTYDGFGSNEAVTDAAFLWRTESGQLLMLWSNYDHAGGKGYRVYIARSPSGNVLGPWEHDTEYLYEKNRNCIYTLYDGGHPSFVRDTTGQLCLVIHSPSTFSESIHIVPIEEVGDTLKIKKYR